MERKKVYNLLGVVGLSIVPSVQRMGSVNENESPKMPLNHIIVNIKCCVWAWRTRRSEVVKIWEDDFGEIGLNMTI
jgi:hypothetical protein